MPSIDDVLEQAENVDNRRTVTVRLLLRQDLARQHADLDAELERAIASDSRENRPDRAPEIAARIAELEAEMEASRVEFVFRAVGRREWVELLAAHPPTKAQLRAVADVTIDPLKRVGLDFNPDTFPVAAVAASCIEPEMDEAAAKRLERAVSDSQWSELWGAVLDVNVGSSAPKASRAAGLIRRLSEQSAITAAPEESDAPSS